MTSQITSPQKGHMCLQKSPRTSTSASTSIGYPVCSFKNAVTPLQLVLITGSPMAIWGSIGNHMKAYNEVEEEDEAEGVSRYKSPYIFEWIMGVSKGLMHSYPPPPFEVCPNLLLVWAGRAHLHSCKAVGDDQSINITGDVILATHWHSSIWCINSIEKQLLTHPLEHTIL